MIYTWCFEEWLSPTLARNISGGTRFLVRDVALKDALLGCGAMEAMVKIAGMFRKNSDQTGAMQLEAQIYPVHLST
jgi:hypothetical protein